LELRFIEYMPLDADGAWQTEQVLTGEEIRRMIADEVGALLPADRPDPSQPATDFEYADGGGLVGFINPVSQPFCGDCNRLRLTADGKVRNCLFSLVEWDARAVMRNGGSDEALAQLVRDSVAAKKPGHGIEDEGFLRPERAMYQIGG
jgi:cyclic pyranopterin phosphate synthase